MGSLAGGHMELDEEVPVCRLNQEIYEWGHLGCRLRDKGGYTLDILTCSL